MTILQTMKQCLGIDPEEQNFDAELALHITAAVDDLRVIGVDVPVTYLLDDDWSIFPSDTAFDMTLQGMIQQYVFVSTKLLFDPPLPATMKVFEDRKKVLQWQIQMHYDNFRTPTPTTGEEVE